MAASSSTRVAYPAMLWTTCFFALLGSLQFGYHLGVLNTCLSWVAEELQFSKETAGAIVVSALLVGAALGSLCGGQVADALGPKSALVFNNAFLLAGSLASAFTPLGFWSMLAGRVLAGVGAGCASVYVPRFIAEIAPAAIRGGLSTLSQVSVCLGILFAYMAGWPYDAGQAFVHVAGHELGWWRLMFLAGVIPAVTQALGLAACPESPVWLEWKGRTAEADAASRQLVGTVLGATTAPLLSHPADAGSDAETALPAAALADEAAHGQGGWGELFARRWRWMMVLAAGLPLLQQFSGINSVIFYSGEVFQQAGLRSPILGSILMGCVNVGGSLVAAGLMDRAGRRMLLVASHAGMAACLLIMSTVMYLCSSADVLSRVSFTCIMLYVACFSLGCGPIPWVYIGEILPERIKGRAGALCTCLNWLAALIIGLVFPAMLAWLKIRGAYLVFTVCNVVAVAFAAALMVETKQQSLHDIVGLLMLRD